MIYLEAIEAARHAAKRIISMEVCSMKKILIALSVLLIVLAGCKKEYDDDYPFDDCEICGSRIFKKRIKVD